MNCPGTVAQVLWLRFFISRAGAARLGQTGHSVLLALAAFSLVHDQVTLNPYELPCRSYLKQ